MRQPIAAPNSYRTRPAGNTRPQLEAASIHFSHTNELQNPTSSQYANCEIILLINAVFYFLHKVFILFDGNQYRLVVIKENFMLLDKTFSSLKGAKISFSRLYGSQACQKDVDPLWSVRYVPQSEWLNTKLAVPLKCYH